MADTTIRNAQTYGELCETVIDTLESARYDVLHPDFRVDSNGYILDVSHNGLRSLVLDTLTRAVGEIRKLQTREIEVPKDFSTTIQLRDKHYTITGPAIIKVTQK